MHPHTVEKPCPACRYLVVGNELRANALWCWACKHYHVEVVCPIVVDPHVYLKDGAA